MKAAQAAKRDEPVDMAFWHEQVMAAAAEEFEGLQAIGNPGRLWEQMASDIFVANIKSKVWGWADTRSTWLLDFWLGFEPRLNFILVVTSPQQALANAMAAGGDAISVDEVMAQWQLYHQELLRFYHRNPQRSILVDAQECMEKPQALLERCNLHWKLSLAQEASAACTAAPQDALALYLANQLCRAYPETASLQHELAATVMQLGSTQQLRALDPSQIIASYHALRDRSAELQQLKAAQEELAALVEEEAALANSLHEAQQESQRQLAEAAQSIDALRQESAGLATARDAEAQARQEAIAQRDGEAAAKAEAITQRDAEANARTALSSQLNESTQENELLLLQLHQVQEELEQYFLEHQEVQKRLDEAEQESQRRLAEAAQNFDALANEKNQLAAARDAEAHGKAQAMAQRDAEATAKAQALAQRDAEANAKAEAIAQRDALANEKNQLAAARDAEAHGKAQAIAQRDAEAAAKAQALAQRDAEANGKAEAIAQRDALANEKNQLAAARDALSKEKAELAQANAAQLKESTQENELLLLQLHQVQEELEHYFLQHQDAQQRLSGAEQRWQRMLQSNPAYCDFQSIEILPSEGGNTTHWRIKELNAVGRSLPELEFETTVTDGVASIALGGQTLPDLGTRDWDLLQALIPLLDRTLATPAALQLPEGFNPQELQNGLAQLGTVIQQLPPTLRFDQVKLQREQVNPDYEHLWLYFENLAFNGKRWPEFEFRLSCANVRPKHFGMYPKLEFPQHTGQAPFEAWFEEAYDDFGAKLELRFALPDAMDLAVWQRLSESDHAFIFALISRLPTLFDRLQSAGTNLKRPWADWLAMAQEVQRILLLRTAAQPQASPATPQPVAKVAAHPSPKAKTRKTKAAR
jgi:hypothetical protein